MNQLELFRSTTNHIYTGKYLFNMDFTPHLENKLRVHLDIPKSVNLTTHFGMFPRASMGLNVQSGNPLKRYEAYHDTSNLPKGSFINNIGVLEIPGSSFHFTQYVSPLQDAKSIEELLNFPYIGLKDVVSSDLKHKVQMLHAENKVASIYIGHMYENAWQIRGYENFLADMILNPTWCEVILDKITELNLYAAIEGAKAGCDCLITADDVANQRALMFSYQKWAELIKPRWAKVYDAARKIKPDIHIWYHSDGNIENIIPDLLEMGVTILNPAQPECLDLKETKSLLAGKAVIDGAIGTQTTMPFGSPDDVKRTIYQRVEELGYDGAYIISPTHVLEPEVPVENVIAFLETIQEINSR